MAMGHKDELKLDVYARVSRLGDDRQRSTEGQVEDCSAVVGARGARVGEVHVDSGRSAWNPRVKRPAWDHLMTRLESGATGGVVVFDLARFSRRPIEGERLIEAAENGLAVLDSEGEYDLLSASGRKHFRDQLAAAAYESDRLSTRVRRGKRVKAMRGEPNHSHRPFGWEQDGIAVRESEAAVVREVARRVLAGENLDKIAADLNARGILTTKGGIWSREALTQMLLKPRNAGEITYKSAVVGRLPGDPVLDPDTWERLTTLFASRRRGRPISDTYLCSGLTFCGRCGNALSGRPRPGDKPYPDGTVRRSYFCHPRRATGQGCGGIAIDQRELDKHVGALVVAILADPRHAEQVETAAKAAESKRQKLEADLADAEYLAEQLSGRLGRQEIKLARYDAAIAPLDRRIGKLSAELAELDLEPAAAPDPAATARSRVEWAARWELAEVPEKRNLIRQAMRGRKIVVGPGRPGRQAPNAVRDRITIEDS